jgi:hypothetical protein
MIETDLFKKGDVVKLSERGRMKFRDADRLGRVLGVSSSGSQIKVQWEGLTTSYLIHQSYLERLSVDQQQDASRPCRPLKASVG